MNRSSHTQISHELLSAYIDGLVTNEEKAEVEAAVSVDAGLAWELETLRRTVEMVRDLPLVPLPRSFALIEDQVADVLAERRGRAQVATPVQRPAIPPGVEAAPRRTLWADILAFFNSGNLLLRNAAAVAALFLVIVLVTSPGAPMRSSSVATQSPEPAAFAFQTESAPEAASAAKAAPAAAADAPAATALESAPAPTDAPVTPAEMKAAPAPLEMAAPAAAMPAAEMPAPEMGAFPAPDSSETGPMRMQAAPAAAADPAGMSARAFPEAIGGGGAPGDSSIFSAPAPSVESQASAPAADAPAEDKAVAQKSDVVETLAEDSAVEALAAAEPAEQEAPLSVAPAAAIAQSETVSPVVASVGWSLWQMAQAVLAGLSLLFALLWLGSRRHNNSVR